jgi:hypothetical protein
MQHKFIRITVALLTFTVGIILTIKTNLPIALMSFLVILFAIPLIILAIVIYRVMQCRSDLRPALGKGLLAVVLWLTIPSLLMLQINVGYILTDSHLQPVNVETILTKLTILILTIAYIFVGAALCYWVNRLDNN